MRILQNSAIGRAKETASRCCSTFVLAMPGREPEDRKRDPFIFYYYFTVAISLPLLGG